MENMPSHSQRLINRQGPNPDLTIGKNRFKKIQPELPIPGAGGTDCDAPDDVWKSLAANMRTDYVIRLDLPKSPEELENERKVAEMARVLLANPKIITAIEEVIGEKLKKSL